MGIMCYRKWTYFIIPILVFHLLSGRVHCIQGNSGSQQAQIYGQIAQQVVAFGKIIRNKPSKFQSNILCPPTYFGYQETDLTFWE